MTKPTLSPSSSAWGTLPDLLLAFAVNRHGTAAWDSIASELQKRTDDPSLALTPQNCRLKYLDLKRRFNRDLDDKSDDAAASLLEELRKLRVAELRREVQRYDLNIELLEMKVKKMEEERERSVRDESESDLEKKSARVQPESEAATAREPVAGGDLEKDQLSVNESNSTDLKAKKLRTAEKDPEPVRTGEDDARQDRTGQVSDEPSELKSESDRKAVREDSCNGSSNSIKKSNRKNKPAGLIEPDTEFPGDDEDVAAAKESSDVQSTASRSRKEEGKNKVRRGSRGGEREDQSGSVKATAESQPLADFLRSIRGQKFGSVFQRRLRSQETSRYQKLILQHMDLETIETRLKEGWYAGGSSSKFFRDLLLLVNNALVFFGKKSAEAKAANDLRQFVTKEIVSQKHGQSTSATRKEVLLQSLSTAKKEAPEPSDSLTLKPRISGSMIVCRKRSSITGKKSGADKKKEQQQERDTKQQHSQQSESSADEPRITNKRTRDRFTSTPANTKKNSKNQSNKNSAAAEKQQGKGGGSSSSSQPSEPKNDNKKSQSTTTFDSSKKRGAANFLNRMKQGSSSPSNNNGALLDALKSRPLTSESTTSKRGSSSEQKKMENSKKKEGPSKRNTTETSQTKEKDSPGKRNVGRPPKRGAAAAASGKRGREKAEMESPPAKQQPKKRTRKL